ncbi:TatD DNase family protein [Desulfonauticus submarinus]|uniref:TatD DNase family protein n=1 Tax=Desulfonauticus submarinus TaxID=206665 RepID=A0A1H0DVN5_9BACT|nr:TatD family hydrolase [Desulfonauticus submarinus]SDN74103.1 TatD DNase family protein [Desulfonauticus submarinus]
MSKKSKIDPEDISLPLEGIDTHAHLSLKHFQNDLENVIQKAKKCGIKYIGNVFLSSEEFFNNIDRLQNNKNIFYILGIHPHDAEKLGNIKEIKKIKDICSKYNIKAIGEIGLDYHYNFSKPKFQKEIFEQQIDLALSLNKPIVIHSREAKEDTFSILNNFKIKKCLFHCFSYDKEALDKILENEWYISLPGTITFKKSKQIQDIAKYTPLNRIMLETDSPYLTPEPYRGKRNEPAFIVFSAYKLAEIKQKDVLEIWKQTAINAKFFFDI